MGVSTGTFSPLVLTEEKEKKSKFITISGRIGAGKTSNDTLITMF